jgi:integrase
MQQLPASPDAFVWLRLYQEQVRGPVSVVQDQPLWWTLRRPFRQLTYHAALRMFTRAGESLGTDWTLHDLRHTAAYRSSRDPEMPLADVILSFRVSHVSDLRCPVVDSVADGTHVA